MMNTYDILNGYPGLRQTLLDSKFLDIIPGGFSIATDVSCQNIIHNPIAARFFRIEPWGQLSYSAPEPRGFKAYRNGKLLAAKDLATQRAAWHGEEVAGLEVEFVWDDGVSKIGRFSSIPLKDLNGNICGAITTMEDITDIVHISRELDNHKLHLKQLVEDRTVAWQDEFAKREMAEKKVWQTQLEKEFIEKNLKLAEDRFTKAFYLSPQQKSIIRLSDWRYMDVNQSFAKARNLAREEILGRTPDELGVPLEEVETVFRLLHEEGKIENLEVVIAKHDGTTGVALLSAEQTEIEGILCGLFDYTEITEIKKMQAEISRLDRLNLVGQMAAGIGHEIRNPMTTIRGFLQILEAKQEYAVQRDTFELMISEIDRANSIITEFLSLARSQPTQQKCQNLNDLLRSLYPMLEANALNQNKQIMLILGNVPDIHLNTNEIRQLVLNLCQNGLEAMPEQAALTVRTFMDSGKVVLSVEDKGFGIAQENLAKLGTPFFTTKDNGTGLGLAICYSIADKHNASISVDTSLEGTTFFVTFDAS